MEAMLVWPRCNYLHIGLSQLDKLGLLLTNAVLHGRKIKEGGKRKRRQKQRTAGEFSLAVPPSPPQLPQPPPKKSVLRVKSNNAMSQL